MKRSILSLFLCFSIAAQAQTLKLKKGQKLNYETLDSREYGFGQRMTYQEVEFRVKAVTKDGYIITVSKPRSITKDDKSISDSNFPLSTQPNTYDIITNKVLSEMSYQIMVNKLGLIQKIEGIEPIKEKVLATFKEMKTVEPYSRENYIKRSFSENNLKAELNRILSVKPVRNIDTVTTGNSRYNITTTTNGIVKEDSVFTMDTMVVSKSMGREVKAGLLISLSNDSTINSTNIKTGELRVQRYTAKINLKSSSVNALGFGPLLLEEIKKSSNYDVYFSPVGTAAQKVLNMVDIYDKSKGKLGVKDSMMKVLDTLDQQMKDTDYYYWVAKVQLIGRLGIDHAPLIKKIPYEYMTNGFYVMLKLDYELKENHTENLTKALNLIFTKFRKGETYPLNISIIDKAIHNDWAKYVFNTNDKTVLLPILNSINEVEHLHFSKLNEMLAGLKTYVGVKLADDNKQLANLISSNNSTAYDKYGRYRLLIYDELSKRGVADSVRMNYIDLTIDKLKNLMADSDNYSKSLRHVTRKYLGDAYYRKSLLMGNTGLNYLQLAAAYVPSQEDKLNNNGELESENVYLPYVPYDELYMAKAGSKDEVLEKYAELVILEPERYTILKEKYLKVYPAGNFKVWFTKVLKAKLPASPAFALQEISGKKVSNTEQQNKFIFIDFWGTWCGACVDEIHKIEELHVNNDKPERLMVTTIACFDKKQYVEDFMAKKNYTYQVLMSDNTIERKFNVQHYPTKLLLLPIGMYVVIPDSENYRSIVDKYMEWEI